MSNQTHNLDQWSGKVAVVTGASSGIGAAIATDLAMAGINTVGLARRKDLIEEKRRKLPAKQQNNLQGMKCDISNEMEVRAAFAEIKKSMGGVDILVNGAGIRKKGNLTDNDNNNEMRETLNVNVMGTLLCTREALQSMNTRNTNGHIVMINGEDGHRVPHMGDEKLRQGGSKNMLQPTKHAITAMTEVMRQELQTKNPKVKISSLSPGATDTDNLTKEDRDTVKDRKLRPEDVSNACMFILSTPPNVQIRELVIKPMGERA